MVPEMMSVLKIMKGRYKFYLIVKAQKSEAEESLKQIVEEEICPEHRIMYATSNEGVCAMVRQLDPSLHIECDLEVVKYLSRFIHRFHLICDKQTDGLKEFMKGTNKKREKSSNVTKPRIDGHEHNSPHHFQSGDKQQA